MSTEKEELELMLKSTPKQVKIAMLLAALLGLFLAVHGVVASVPGGTFSARFVLLGIIIFLVFLSNGVALIKKSRWAYGLLIVFSLLPLFGSFVGAVHLLAMAMRGEAGVNLETLLAIMETIQLLLIITLLVYLVSGPVRRFIWKADNREEQLAQTAASD